MVALVGICGSTRSKSINRSLLIAVAEALPAGTTLEILKAPLELPIFNSDFDDPAEVIALKAAAAGADGIVFAVPEYNYSIPGGLKNALDWMSRPPASSPLRQKPIALVGAATGMSGTIRAQTHLRAMLVYSDSAVMNQPEILIPRAHERFADGVLTDESTRQLLARFGIAFTAFVEKHHALTRMEAPSMASR